MRILRVLSVIFVLLTLSINVMAKSNNIPLKDFFKSPDFRSLQLSPNGQHIAVISPINKRDNLVIMDTDGLKNVRPLTGLKEESVSSFYWANNQEIVFTMDSDGREAVSIFKVDITKKKPKIVLLVGAKVSSAGIRTATTVHRLPNDPDNIIVQFNGRDVKAPDLYKLPLKSKWSKKRGKNPKMKLIAENPGDVQGWLLDHDGNVRGAISLKGVESKFHYKNKGEKNFRVLRATHALAESITPLVFDYDNKTLFVSSNIGRDKNAIYKFNPETNKLGELLFSHDEVDVRNLMMSDKLKKIIGVSYINEYPEVFYFDKKTKAIMEGLESAFPGKKVSITSSTKDEMLNIVMVYNDNDPGNYFLYDRHNNKITHLLSARPNLKPDELVSMKAISFTSRDGLKIHGYLTLPKGSDGKKVPLIVNPHGGPFGVRDSWGYNPEHQFFASRGYATVQVNFRGSGGYGREFEQAGYGGKWGAEMQNDLTDAVEYLVTKGIVDPKKICIYGASYGGYATMAGLTFTPDLYRCGINYVGVTDVGLLYTSMKKSWEPAKKLMKLQIGDPDDKELMKRMSPLAHVDKIKAPLMIVQGAQDPRVVKQHATDLRSALKSRGIVLSDDEWIMKKNEGHGFRKEENIIELYTKMEKFLAKNLQ